MNVCLQSLIACPAFLNLLSCVGEALGKHKSLFEHREVLMKLVEISRYFEPRIQFSESADYNSKIVNAESILRKEINIFNPDRVQADCSEFLSHLLDLLHEELKDLYVDNKKIE
jgi:ubiquitin C-terminal hydrolase